MDPNETIRLMRLALHEGDEETAKELAHALWQWVERGGWLPEDMTDIGLKNELNEVFARCGR
jgi:DNA gyrase inhibitor GyrI